jgi:hypothetical protein
MDAKKEFWRECTERLLLLAAEAHVKTVTVLHSVDAGLCGTGMPAAIPLLGARHGVSCWHFCCACIAMNGSALLHAGCALVWKGALMYMGDMTWGVVIVHGHLCHNTSGITNRVMTWCDSTNEDSHTPGREYCGAAAHGSFVFCSCFCSACRAYCTGACCTTAALCG